MKGGGKEEVKVSDESRRKSARPRVKGRRPNRRKQSCTQRGRARAEDLRHKTRARESAPELEENKRRRFWFEVHHTCFPFQDEQEG